MLASASLRSRRACSEKIIKELVSGLSFDGLGVKLDTFHFKVTVPQRHHFVESTVLEFRPRGDIEAVGNRILGDNQRVITRHLDRIG